MVLEKPDWIRIRLPIGDDVRRIEEDLIRSNLHTICQEAICPNQGECFSRGVATYLIMGNVCTRNCGFCAVTPGQPEPLDWDEPERLADEVLRRRLRYVVITSVTRDDLPDGGAEYFARVIQVVRKKNPGVGIEVLIPDFRGSAPALRTVIDARPDVLNHNVETVPRLYPKIRPQADYSRSIKLLKRAKEMNGTMINKSGIMVGLGETTDEVKSVMKDLREVDCDILTIGQYLCPSEKHQPVKEYVRPEVFGYYQETALKMGFKDAVSSPLVRSSYMAEQSFRKAIRNSSGGDE